MEIPLAGYDRARMSEKIGYSATRLKDTKSKCELKGGYRISRHGFQQINTAGS
jgi:hypothetical protein